MERMRRPHDFLVVLGEEELTVDPAAWRIGLESLFQVRLLEELLLDPQRHCNLERSKAARSIGEIGLQQALELDERLFEENDMVDAVEIDLCRIQTIADGLVGKARIMLLAAEALLLSRCDSAAVLDKSGRTVVVEGRDA